MSRLLRRISLALATLCLFQAAAEAQTDYPKQPVRVIVANTPGTAVDTLVRVLAPRMSQVLGQQIYVENRAGAGGTIGAEAAAKAAADGYTILATSTPLQVIAPHLRKNLRYDPFNDFDALAMYARTENVLIINPKLPMRSVEDIIAYAKRHPGKLKMSNAGIGFQSHLAGVMFTTMADIEVLHVPYKGASSSNSVMTGESDLTIAPLPSVFSMIRNGSVRAIAVTGIARSPVAPELPTIDETGVPGYQASGWSGFIVPKGLPRPVFEKLTDAVVLTLRDESTREHLLRAGGEPWLLTGKEMTKVMQEEFERYGDVIRKARITLD